MNATDSADITERLSQWIHCICVVTFDLELGQAMEAIYPPHIELSEKEKLNICYLAFPDSNSGCIGDTRFHIRLRVAPGTKNTLLNPHLQRFSLQCATVQRPDLGHYWGFVYFRQTKDSSLPRGYFQKSVILLTRLPFINLYYEVLSLIATKFFDGGENILQATCTDISNWPQIQAGECMQLSLLGTLFQTYIPSLTSANLQQTYITSNTQPIDSMTTETESVESHMITNTRPIESVSSENISNTDNCSCDNVSLAKNETDEHYEATSSTLNEESRKYILDSYKQSKEVLLAQDTKPGSNSNCDSRSIEKLNPNPNEVNNDNTDNGDTDELHDIKYSDKAKNTQSGQLNTVEQTLQSQQAASQAPIVLSSVNEIDIFRGMCAVLPYTHLLWELVLTAEPIVVMSTSPSDCSHMVQALMSLIAPLPYAAEARPYFTIHDSEFKEFTQRQQGPVPIIVGVTNPFFSKTLQHWPHLIRMADTNGANISGNTMNASTPNSITQQGLRKLKFLSKLMDSQAGVYTQYKPFLQKDKAIIRNLLAGMKKKRPAEVQSAILRRHLLELTQSFMIPLERYMASLMPLQKDISAFRAAPTPHHFKQDCFLSTLEQSGPQLTAPLKGDWTGLYKRFFRSPNFLDWYEHRYRELTQTLQHLQMQALSNTNLKQWVAGKHEVEIVDMILKVKQKLKICNEISIDGLPQVIIAQNKQTRRQLQKHLDDMKRLLPDDLKKILSS